MQVCENDCGYCGIRKHQRRARRYTMPRDEVVEVAEWAFSHRMGTLMLQSGELDTPQRLRYLTQVVRDIKARTAALDAEQRCLDPAALTPPAPGVGLCVALSGGRACCNRAVSAAAALRHRRKGAAHGEGTSCCTRSGSPASVFASAVPCCGADAMPRLRPPPFPHVTVGELSRQQYQQLRDAGADRYLLRIESSNPELYASIHPPSQARPGTRSKGCTRARSWQVARLVALAGNLSLARFNQHCPALPRRNGRTGCGACRTSKLLGSWWVAGDGQEGAQAQQAGCHNSACPWPSTVP